MENGEIGGTGKIEGMEILGKWIHWEKWSHWEKWMFWILKKSFLTLLSICGSHLWSFENFQATACQFGHLPSFGVNS